MIHLRDKTKNEIDLREKAEQLLADKKGAKSQFSIEDFDNLFHELSVHQIELEMQNLELQQTQEEINKSREEYFRLYDLAPVGYVNLDEHGLVVKANLKFIEMLEGISPEIIIGKSLVQFMNKKHADLFHVHLRDALKTGHCSDIETEFKHGDNHFYAQVKMVVNSITDGISGCFRVTIIDISQRRQAENDLQKAHDNLEQRVAERTLELQQTHKQLLHAEKLSAVGQLSASIAHEINNPLNGVMNVFEGVKSRAVLSERDKGLVQLALKECNRMKDLIIGLRQFYKPTSGVREACDIHHLVDEVLFLINKELKKKNITFKKELPEDIPAIWAVQDQIKQVLINVLSNAIDAIVKESGTITLSTALYDKETICIAVKDSGEGIKPESINNIFEPFHTTKSIKGTGLGLSVSYGIIKNHGGDIIVDSKVGQGTTFTILLPISNR